MKIKMPLRHVGLMPQKPWIYVFAICVLLWLATSAAQQSKILNGTVVRVADGDTFFVDTGHGAWIEIRLYGVDCPERAWEDRWPAQPWSDQAKQFIISKALNQKVSIRLTGERTHGRDVGEAFVNGQSLSRELLRAGLAWWNKKFARYDQDLERLETQAKAARLGIWSTPNPIPPWRHRYNHR